MNDFSEHEDQHFFHHNNDQSDDEGVGGPMSPPLQYHQLRGPVELNFNHPPFCSVTINQCTRGWHDFR